MRKLTLIICVVVISSPVAADLAVFDLRGSGGPFDFDAAEGSYLDPDTGIQLDFTAMVGSQNVGQLNATSSSFGINAPGGGDDTDQLDGDEWIAIDVSGPASVALQLHELDVVGFSEAAGDSGLLDLGPHGSSPIAPGTATIIPPHDLLDQAFSIRYTGTGNGFGLRSITLQTTAIPEPSAFALLSLLAPLPVLRFAWRRYRHVSPSSGTRN